MRILVTGSSGAVGNMVIREALKQGHDPIGFDRSMDTRFMGDILGRYESIQGDVLDWPRLLETVQRYQPESIIHTAYLLPDLAQANPYMAVQVNVVGTANMVELARLSHLRLAFTSTKGVLQDFGGEYGHPTYKAANEEFPVIAPNNNHTLYNDTKVFNEHYLNKCRVIFGLDHIILRFASMYGPGRIRHGSRAILSEMIESAFERRPYVLEQGGDQRDDMIYLRDVARGCILAAEAPADRLRHRTFLIGSGQLVTLKDAAAEIEKTLPQADLEIRDGLDPMRLGMVSYGLLDISRARDELGYQPAYPLAAAIPDYVDTLQAINGAASAAR